MWWFGQQDSTKGAWDVDLHGRKDRRNRRYGLSTLIRGFLCLIAFVILLKVLPIITHFFEGNQVITLILYILSHGIPLFALTIIQIPVGLYYFLRYFKVK